MIQNRGIAQNTYPQNSKAMQELQWICELSVSLLPRFASIAEARSGINS